MWMTALQQYIPGASSGASASSGAGGSGTICFCPMAKDITRDTLGGTPGGWWTTANTTFLAWGREGTNGYDVPIPQWARPGMAGSYGMNGWMANPSPAVMAANPGIAATASSYWGKLTAAGRFANAPLFGDCVWPGTNPTPNGPLDQPPAHKGDCPVGANMPSFCIPRHTGRSPLDMAFIDGSVSGVGLRQLWQLPWSKTYDTALVPPNVDKTVWLKSYN
jgi:hypothetical protein